ncbi:MAG: hypothetical protein KatS3mg082_2423 [Nitrospiraceae bacterium]|nr:MAG: hypothetical protein KatS3mg082_2423 [Nitrospiraceae bacterium]
MELRLLGMGRRDKFLGSYTILMMAYYAKISDYF